MMSRFFNVDEYKKTVLEYAIEFNNYDFIKFFIDNKYIWFDSGDSNDYGTTFGAGTSIPKTEIKEHGNECFSYIHQFIYNLRSGQKRSYCTCC